MKKVLTWIGIGTSWIFGALVCLLPAFLILGILDFRFHNYFWPDFNSFRVFSPISMFDFFSILDLFVLILLGASILKLVTGWLGSGRSKSVGSAPSIDRSKSVGSAPSVPGTKFRWIYLSVLFVACGVIATKFFYVPVEPVIKSFWFQSYMNYVSPVLLFIAVLFGARDRKTFRLLLVSFFVTFIVFGGIVIYEYFTNALPGDNKDFLGRLVWPYIDPFFKMKAESANYLSYLFAPIAVLAGVSATRKALSAVSGKTSSLANVATAGGIFRVSLSMILEIICFAVCVFVLLLTKSYTGIGIASLIIAYLIFINVSRKAKISLVVAFALLSAVFVATQWNTRKFQILIGNDKSESSVSMRSKIYKFNFEAFLRKPWTGIGPGNYQNFFRENVTEFTGLKIADVDVPPHPHSLIVAFWSDLGILGLVGILIIYIGVFYEAFLRRLTLAGKNGKAWLTSLYFLVPLYFLGHGLLDVPYGTDENSVMFWLFLAMAFAFKA